MQTQSLQDALAFPIYISGAVTSWDFISQGYNSRQASKNTPDEHKAPEGQGLYGQQYNMLLKLSGVTATWKWFPYVQWLGKKKRKHQLLQP